jgi:D-alanyl-lipoteichoic acid acyltransferase DltB (MBOAT superfamily)
MMFDSATYWVFFFAVEALVVTLSVDKAKVALVVASFFFYGFWDVRFDLLLGASTVLNYLIGLRVVNPAGAACKKWLVLGIGVNLVILGFFKYYNFFASSVASVLGLPADQWALAIVLPVGISFFTFEGIAYLVDIYKKEIVARRNLLDFALFLSFFPHLIAGPIIRPKNFFPQVGLTWNVTHGEIRWAFIQIVKGMFKKVVLADSMAVVADSYFNGSHTTLALFGVLAFTLQIYFDFSGYTDIARGCAMLLGFRFPSNFERPYFAQNISEFWRRWHISLSTWLRDYLYIPLGGNRAGDFVRYRNYLVVMGLGGLWHGASWNFLLWGLYHGALLLMHRLFIEYAPKSILVPFDTRLGRSFGVVITFTLVMLGWVPFRAASFAATRETLSALATTTVYHLSDIPLSLAIVAGISIAFCFVDKGRQIQNWMTGKASLSTYITCLGIVGWMTVLFAHRGTSIPFIYFRF